MELFLPIAHMDVNIVLILLYGALVGFLSSSSPAFLPL